MIVFSKLSLKRDYLREKGFLAATQINGAVSINYKVKSNGKEEKVSKKEKLQVKQEKKSKVKETDVLEGQISIFALLAI